MVTYTDTLTNRHHLRSSIDKVFAITFHHPSRLRFFLENLDGIAKLFLWLQRRQLKKIPLGAQRNVSLNLQHMKVLEEGDTLQI